MYLNETLKSVMTGSKFLFLVTFLVSIISFANNSAEAMPLDTVQVVAKHPESGRGSAYQVNFEISKPIPPKATIRVLFPDEFDLSDLMIAGSTTINGGFDLQVNSQVLTMKRSGLGREIPANEKVDVKFAIIKNPKEPADNYKLVIEILDETEQTIVKREKLHKIIPSKE